MIRLIEPTTLEVLSEEFIVLPGQNVGLVSSGLAGAEVMTVHAKLVDGTFRALTAASATMTASAQDTSIISGGVYKVHKVATVSPSGLAVGI